MVRSSLDLIHPNVLLESVLWSQEVTLTLTNGLRPVNPDGVVWPLNVTACSFNLLVVYEIWDIPYYNMKMVLFPILFKVL